MRKLFSLLGAVVLLPLAANAEVAETFELESGRAAGIASGVAIDFITHGSDSVGVWAATGKGVNYTYDNGAHWFIYNMAHGLPAENLSAIFSIGSRIWVGSNHDQFIEGQLRTLSDGLSYSDNDGEDWVTLDFGPDGLDIPFVEGGDRTIFDITGHSDQGFLNNRAGTAADVDWMFFSAFAGALLASQDGGINWRRVFPSPIDSLQYSFANQAPSLRNRLFSCVTDTSHGDTLFLWAGTAGGVFQYVYAPPRDKLYSRRIDQITFCDTCSASGGSRVFLGGENGLVLTATTLGTASGDNMVARFEVDGLPGPGISAIHSIGDKLIVGTVDTAGASTGLAVSTDDGDSFTTVFIPWSPGAGNVIVDFESMAGRVYAATQNAGLHVSLDSGWSWSQVPFDTLYASPALDVANAVSVMADTLMVGTDSGLVKLTLDAGGSILNAVHLPFVDSDSSGARIIRIRPQIWQDTLGVTHRVLWTIHRPIIASGISMVGRYGIVIDTIVDIGQDPPDTTFDTLGFQWSYLRRGVTIHDVNFFKDTAFVVGENSVWFTPRGEEPTNFFPVRQYRNDTLVVASLDNDTVTVMEVRQDTVIFGTKNGLAISHDRGATFVIYRANLDTLVADLVINHSYISSIGGLAGNFIPALAVQYSGSESARIWAGTRPAEGGDQGISTAAFDAGTGLLEWQTVYEDDFAWNFAFMGDTILAATNNGLLMNDGQLDSLNTVWVSLDLINQSSGEVLVDPGTAVFGVEVVDSVIWVGTDDGTVRVSRSDLGRQTLFQRVDSTTASDEVYAFPVPFSPNRGQTVDFHYVVEQGGRVTLEIYDFAMNLVARPIDNVEHGPGIYPTQGSQGIAWDGYNDRGALAAVGIYYFKIVQSSGNTRWGKLAIIP